MQNIVLVECCKSVRSSSVGGSDGPADTGDLVASANDALARGVGDGSHVLVLGLGALPNLHLATTPQDTDSHGREEVVGGVGVVVDTAVKDGSGVLANGRRDQSLATGVVGNELANVVDDTSNRDPSLAVLRLLNKVVPADNREALKRDTPVEGRALLVELLLQLLNTALLDLVVGEGLEVVGEAKLLHGPDEPLGRVVLPPLDGVAEITRELVVEARNHSQL